MSDYTVGDTIYHKFSTRAFATGVPTTLAGTPVVSIYEDDSVTQITAGITLTVDFDSVTGLNHLTVVATGGNGFEIDKFYQAVITTGTVGGVSVVGETVWTFSLGAGAAAQDLANGTDGLGAIKGDTAATKTKTDFLPSATAGNAGGVFIAGTNAATTVTTSFTTTFTGNLTGSVASVTAINTTGGAVDNVTLTDTVTTYTGNTPQTGDAFLRLATYRLGELMSAVLASQPFTGSMLGDLTQDNSDDTGTQQFSVAALMRAWDEVISMPRHNIGQSAGKILRLSGNLTQIDGAVSDVSPATTGFDTDLTQADTFFEDAVMIFVNGAANAGIGKPVSTYLNANGAVTFLAPDDWPVTPVNGDDFIIFANHVHPVAQIATAVWDELTGDITTANSIGKLIVDFLDAAISSRATPAQVNAEVLDVLTVDTFAEPGSVPAATASLEDKIGWLMSLARNKLTQTATTYTLRDDTDSSDIATATVSDDTTTFTRNEFT